MRPVRWLLLPVICASSFLAAGCAQGAQDLKGPRPDSPSPINTVAGAGAAGSTAGTGGAAGTAAPVVGTDAAAGTSSSNLHGGAAPQQDAGGGAGGSGGAEPADAGVTQLPEGPCEDGVQGDDETDVDCGGPDCPACEPGAGCVYDSDCASMRCVTPFVCAEPDCSDGLLNGDETDVDCGGGCATKCPAGDNCNDDTDCESGICEGGTCGCAALTVADCAAEQCGTIDDGCGGTIDCPDQCVGGPCIDGACCQARQVMDCSASECGTVDDGCGSTIVCPDNCAAGQACMGGTCQMVQCNPNSCPNCGLLERECCTDVGQCGCEPLLFGSCG